MNFQKYQNFTTGSYYIGLDIGTDSVGYAVADTDYNVCKHKGQPMMGATLFEAAQQSTDRRNFRSARRRLKRRQERVKLVQDLFAEEIYKVDTDFFKKLSESALYAEDREYEHYDTYPFGKEYHIEFPTIHHLIDHLMKTDEKADIRYIYTACVWLVAHRGHFLSDIKIENAESLTDTMPAYLELMQWFIDNGYEQPWECEAEKFIKIINGESISSDNTDTKKKMSIKDKENEIEKLCFDGKPPKEDFESYPFSKKMLYKLLCGGACDIKKLFIADEDLINSDAKDKIDLKDAEKLEVIMAEYSEYAPLLEKLLKVYDSVSLNNILGDFKTISEAKKKVYETHKNDLKNLKYLIKKYFDKDEYDKMFRSSRKDDYYSAYVANYKSSAKSKKYDEHANQKTTYEEFLKKVAKMVGEINPNCVEDEQLKNDIIDRCDSQTYMPKQVNTNNRVIPRQLYQVELRQILKKAAVHYDFLNEVDDSGISVAEKIESIFTFRVPYFVGPLNKNSEHAWIERKAEGKIYPWNFKDKVDYEKSEEAFIRRLTGKCSYLPSEDVIAKNSLLYTKYNVLNEINNIKIDNEAISVELKQKIFNTLFMPNGGNKSKVTYKSLVDFLVSEGEIKPSEKERISGIDKNIKSSLKPWFDFYPYIMEKKLTEKQIEDIIFHSTCTEETKRFRSWLKREFPSLSENDIKSIAAKNYSDFGRLSEKLLNGIEGTSKINGDTGTVMYFLWNTNDNLMQILNNEEKYNFKSIIEDMNHKYYKENPQTLEDRLNSMYVPPAVKRSIYRTLDIVEDIISVKKATPKKVFIEMTRHDDLSKKGKTTDSRKKALLEKLKKVSDNDSKKIIKLLNDMGADADSRLRSEKLFLYCSQLGKCMYCGKPIELSELFTNKYDVDHIYPRSVIKDDSVHNNKALVHSEENGTKGDKYPINPEIRNAMTNFWSMLKEHGLISEEKYKRLTRNSELTYEEKMGFINRQIVETGQSTKAVATLLKEMLPEETEIVYVKASQVSDFRHDFGSIREKAYNTKYTDEEKRNMQLFKSRSINDLHHAYDAYLNIVVGNVYNERFTKKFFDIKSDKYSLNSHMLFGTDIKRNPDAWTPSKHLKNVEKAMKCNHIHLTKYQTEQKGGLFDQMPLAKKDTLHPRKNGLDSEKYGGYNKLAVAFYVLAKYKSGKKTELSLVPVEVMYSKKFKEDKDFALNHIKSHLGSKATDITLPLGYRIIKTNAVFSLDGYRVCLAGKSGKKVVMRSLESVFYKPEQTQYIKRTDKMLEKLLKDKNYVIDEEYDKITADDNLNLLMYLKEKIESEKFKKLPGAAPKINDDALEKFKEADIASQIKCLSQIILYLKSNRAGTCDITLIGGSKQSGIITLSLNLSNWKYDDIRIIDTSASGLYEKQSQNLKDLL